MTKTRVPADVYDQLERIALGMYGRRDSGYRDNERDAAWHWGSGKTDRKLAQDLLATLEKETDGDVTGGT